MGTVRLLLAIVVVMGHAYAHNGLSLAESGWGRLRPLNSFYAVPAFFAISGFYMALVLEEKYLRHKDGPRLFYFSRYFRLFPTYCVVAFTTVVTAIFAHKIGLFPCLLGPHWQYGLDDLFKYMLVLVSNLTLIGQDLATHVAVFKQPSAYCYMWVPQAWSISTEIVFYLLAPFLVRRRTVWLLALAGASVAIRWAVWENSVLDSSLRQKFFPSDLYFFVLGILAYRVYQAYQKVERINVLNKTACLGAAALMCAAVVGIGNVLTPFTFGECVRDSLWVGLAVFVLLPFAFHGTRHSALDRFLGDLTYPLYMWHICVMTVLPAYVPHWGGWMYVVVSLGVSYLTVLLVERPVERWRRWVFRQAWPGECAQPKVDLEGAKLMNTALAA